MTRVGMKGVKREIKQTFHSILIFHPIRLIFVRLCSLDPSLGSEECRMMRREEKISPAILQSVPIFFIIISIALSEVYFRKLKRFNSWMYDTIL